MKTFRNVGGVKNGTADLWIKSNPRVKRRDPWHRANVPPKAGADLALIGEDVEKAVTDVSLPGSQAGGATTSPSELKSLTRNPATAKRWTALLRGRYDYMRSCCQPMMPYMMPNMQPGMMMPGMMMPGMQPGMPMEDMEEMQPGMMPQMQPGMMPQMQPVNTVGLEPGMEAGLQSPSLAAMPINLATSQQQATPANEGFLQAYLTKLIGTTVRVEFLIGTNMLTDRTGVVEEVGVNYIVLRDLAGARVMGDLYAIKFVTSLSR